MQTKQPWLAWMIGSATAWVVTASMAAGLGSGSSSAVLGQPLDFSVQVRLEAGESLGPECVAAEVTAGDRRVPPSLVRTQVEVTGPSSARVRVLTQSRIEEPVIGVQLSVGCAARVSRRYVVLADPPAVAAVSAAPSFAANPAPAPELPAVPADTGANVAAAPAGAESQPAAAGESAPAAAAAPSFGRPLRAALRQAPPDPEAAARRAQRRAERRAAAQAARAARQARAAAAPAAAVAADAAARAPVPARLKLEITEPVRQAAASAAVEQALAVVAQAASAARAAASAASASAERIATLERTVEQLRGEAKSSRELATQFRQRLADAEGPSAWMLPLLVAAALLAALAGWLAWRLNRLQARRQQGWREAVAPQPPAPVLPDPITEATPSRQPTTPIPFVTSELRPSAAAAAAQRQRVAPAWPPPAPAVAWPPPDSMSDGEVTLPLESPMERTEPMPARISGAGDGARDVTIEELIDLEQQAEFFIVLGQEDAAIELLNEHLDNSGGGSPLPFLKLLEIHHRRNDHEAYDRIRLRFNARFNAYAPEWGVDLGSGRTLDDYPGVIPRLQEVWPRPLDAMAELEALLFRKSRGELFDLPAYREVLFLYSLARDLLDRGAADDGNVDLLLPMGGADDRADGASGHRQGLDRDAFRDTQIPEDRLSGPVDFDLGAGERRTSIFDLLDDKPHLPRQP